MTHSYNAPLHERLINGSWAPILLGHYRIESLIETYLDGCFTLTRKSSNAATIDGELGAGALISSLRPLSSTAFDVVGPNAPIRVPF